MFYLRLNKIKIENNGALLGMSEVQLMSFVTMGETDFPMLHEFYRTSDLIQKKQLISEAVTKVVSSRIMPEIQRVKDNQTIYFGDTGYNVYVSETIPDNLNWLVLALKSNQQTIDNAALLSQILTDKNLTTIIGIVSLLAKATNPVTAAVTEITTLVANSIFKLSANAKDKQLGLLLTSFNRTEHYPYGKRDAQDVPDTSGNMKIDYTIFGF